MDEAIERAAEILINQHYVVCLTGAGMSVESGIRPFRGPGGIWTEHGQPPLDDYRRFVRDPVAYWKNLLEPSGIYRELYQALEQAQPHRGHDALAALERCGVVRYIITQNIDDLHRKSGSVHVSEIHGNYSLCRCISCGTRFKRMDVDVSLLPPRCPVCSGLVKSDVVIFGEPIPEDSGRECVEQVECADCMLLVGTSACVYPAAGFPKQVVESGGMLIEIGPHPTEITDLCQLVLRGTAAKTLPLLADAVHARIANGKQK